VNTYNSQYKQTECIPCTNGSSCIIGSTMNSKRDNYLQPSYTFDPKVLDSSIIDPDVSSILKFTLVLFIFLTSLFILVVTLLIIIILCKRKLRNLDVLFSEKHYVRYQF
jgi:uncharacterized membrane protein